MASGVLANESVFANQGIFALSPTHMPDCDLFNHDRLIRMRSLKTQMVIQGVRLSCRCSEVWGCRLASALGGTGTFCSVTTEADVAGGAETLDALGAIDVAPCNDVAISAGRCNGKTNTARTGEFNVSPSNASREATFNSRYPGASSEPTANGRAGFPSTEINAAPCPVVLAMMPDRRNLSDGTGPGPAALGGAAPRSLANAAGLNKSGNGVATAVSVLAGRPAAMPACIQYQADTTTVAQISAVNVRQPKVCCSLDISNSSSHGDTSLRKPSHGMLSSRPTVSRVYRASLQGFTLIELMVVLVIIGVLAALIVPNVLDRADDARVMAARTDVNNLQQALKLYRLDNQRLPSSDQGLQSLTVKPAIAPVPANWKPYLDKLPSDPWGRPYQYLYPGIKGEFDVMSLGADGQPGGEGKNADIGSWQ